MTPQERLSKYTEEDVVLQAQIKELDEKRHSLLKQQHDVRREIFKAQFDVRRPNG